MIETEVLLDVVIEGAKEKRANNIVSMNFQETNNSICDYFVVCDAQSNRQVASIAKSIEEFTYNNLKIKLIHKEGYKNSQWILLDYGDVMVHVFQEEAREFYNLEGLWADAKITKIDDED